jgi:chromosome segregation ATPase
MLTGRQTLDHLSTTLRTARNELERLDRELQATSNSIAMNRRHQAQALKRLAAMRLDAIRQGDVAKRIDSADSEVQKILDRRQTAIAVLNERVSATRSALLDLEERRERLHDEVDSAAQVLAEREGTVQMALESDAEFQAQIDRTHEADAIAVSAEEKAQVALDDRRVKGQPYEGDELFMYLWNRGYGTSEYRANPLARLLDASVARLCKYHDARPNYWLLLEIPKRLREHADGRRADADSELDALQSLEEAAAKEGGVHAAKSALAELEQRQDELDESIAQSEAELHALQAEQSQYAAGDDDYIAKCLSVFAETLQRRDVVDLTQLARSTMTTDDDAVVDDLRHLRDADHELENELDRNRNLHREHLRRVQELEQVRQQFKRNRYDDLRSGFDNGDVIKTMMRQVLGGALRGGALWDVLRQYQRYRDVGGAWPDFGSGGVPRTGRRPPARRPTWHWPGGAPSSRRGGFKLPRAPKAPRRSNQRGRGGFRTGGRF